MLTPLHLDESTPWQQRFRAPHIYWSQIASRAPAHGLVGTDLSGVLQLHRWDVPGGSLTQLTNRPAGSPFGILAPDGRYVYYFDDHQGNEIGHYMRLPLMGGEPHNLTPALPPYASWELAVSGAGNLLAFAVAEPDGFHLYVIEVGAGDTLSHPRHLCRYDGLTFGPYLSYDGTTLVLMSSKHSTTQQFSLVAVDVTSGERIGALWDGPETSIGTHARAFFPHTGDQLLLAVTNRTGTRRPLMWNPRSGERTDLELGSLVGQVTPWDWSPDGEYVLLCAVRQAVQELYLYRRKDGTLKPLRHPTGTYWGAYWTPAGDIYAEWEDANHPRQLIAIDESAETRRVVLQAGRVPPGHPWRSITFPSSDGQQIQGWLSVPDSAGPFPMILEVHGGPTSWVSEQFSPESQAWGDHGFAYATINYRGSPTFGRSFEEQVFGDVGHWEVEDMVAARAWLVEQGIAQPDQVFVTGWSYGGYLTLQALGTRPELWAGGMAGTAIADWTLMYEDIPANHRSWLRTLFRGTPEEKVQEYTSRSPSSWIENVQAPILVLQGRHDSRCPARQMEVYVEQMRKRGKRIEIHWFDSGHGSLVTEERIEHQALMLRFAHRVLGDAFSSPGLAADH
jgi:dienelactone hydrolase